MKEIPIKRKGEIVAHALVDDEDYDRVSQYSWHLHEGGYARSGTTIDGRKVKFYMHRFILQVDEPIDHADGNKLNNLRSNLRPVNASQNGMNKRSRSGSTSQYKGVSYQSARGKWFSMIEYQDISYFLGRFKNEEEAARAYDRKALELFGEFARTNFPKEDYTDAQIPRSQDV